MLESNISAVKNDVKTLLTDSRALLNAAAELTGDKADEVRQRGMQLLDSAMLKAHDAQSYAMHAGRDAVSSADGYVKKNPWSTIAMVAGIGVLAGVILGRK